MKTKTLISILMLLFATISLCAAKEKDAEKKDSFFNKLKTNTSQAVERAKEGDHSESNGEAERIEPEKKESEKSGEAKSKKEKTDKSEKNGDEKDPEEPKEDSKFKKNMKDAGKKIKKAGNSAAGKISEFTKGAAERTAEGSAE